MIPAVLAAGVSLPRDSGFITAAYVVLTALTIGVAWAQRGIGRWAGALIIALYLAVVSALWLTA